jgi:hypothetical protein
VLPDAARVWKPPADRNAVYRELNVIYDLRSKLVHGSKVPKPEAVDEAARTARSLAAEMLRRGLGEGWPTRQSLEALALD